MAGYRPKSLDELNNLYGKAISAENEIKKSSSLLKEEVLSDIIGGEKNTQERSPRAPERRESGFSSDIDAFIRQFSGEQGASSVSETLAKKPAPQPPQPPRPVFDGQRRSERKNESEKQENLSGLMNDYARIMSGEEDDDDEESPFSSRKPLFKNRRSDKKGKKKNSKDIIQDTSEPAREAEPAPEKPQDAFTGESASNEFSNAAFEKHEDPAAADADGGIEPYEGRRFEPAGNDGPGEQSKAFAPSVEEDAEKADEESFDEAFEPIPDGSDDFVFGSVEAPRPSGGVIFAKVVLSVLLAVTLLATVLTGIGVFSVNSERALPGGILTFCATNAYEDAGIQSNDFIICKKQDYINDGEKVIYINRELRSFSFGVKNGEKTDISGNVYYKVSSEQIEKNDVLGVIVKTVPSLGKLVRIVVENYLFILLGLVTLAIVLTLILCLAFRKRRYRDDFYDEDFEEEESEQQEAPFEPEQENAVNDQTESGEEDFDSDSLYSGIE